MTIFDDALATAAAEYAGVVRQVAELTADLAQMTAERNLFSDKATDLQKQLDALKNPLPTFQLGMAYRSNTDPAPVEKRLGGPVAVSRTYWSATQGKSAAARVKADAAAGRAVSEVSFKAPLSWADMAAGKGDDWATTLRDTLVAANPAGHLIRLAVHHEPEDDGKTAALRDQWKAMQNHLAPIFDVAGIEFIVILMGYHELAVSSSLYKVWRLDLAVPDHPAIKGVGYDLYQSRGVIDAKTGKAKGWRDLAAYAAKIQAFHATRPGLKWGLSEHAHTDTAEAEHPGLIADTVKIVRDAGGSWLDWFSSNLNSAAEWEMAAGSTREKAFAAELAG